jgi:hypothetical protein
MSKHSNSNNESRENEYQEQLNRDILVDYGVVETHMNPQARVSLMVPKEE